MRDDYIPHPMKLNVGNPPDPPDDECRYQSRDGICHDPDHDCPKGEIVCCDDCWQTGECQYVCGAVGE